MHYKKNVQKNHQLFLKIGLALTLVYKTRSTEISES